MDNLNVGIISTNSIKYGKTKTGKSIYSIYCLNPKVSKNLKITYGGNLKGNIVIVFKLENENKPLLYQVLGIMDEKILDITLQYHYNIYKKQSNFIGIYNELMESQIKRIDYTHLNIFSIDPKDSLDIDDAISFQKLNSKYIVGIHIAQPIYWINKEELLNTINKSFSTLYTPKKNYSLFSKNVEIKSSLLENEKRPAFSIFFYFDEKKILNKIEHYPSFIINKLATSYDDINFCHIQDFKIFTELLINKEIDSKELISYWMIKTNQYIGQNFNNIPFRIQDKPNINNVSFEIKEIFEKFYLKSASYSIDKNYHYGLNVDKYSHFTSPIRRIIDCLIHWQITYNDDINFDLERINFLDKQTKKFHREIELNEIIKNIKNGIYNGYIFNKINRGLFLVYFKEFGIFKVKIIDEKLYELIDIEKEKKLIIGSIHEFIIEKKNGFLPKDKILIMPNFSILN